MKNPKISVIIPIYNVEDYLEDTLHSLLNQSFIENMEILMIDDGSTDDSRYIIEKYALDYDNFYAFHKKNEGLAITRNFGIAHANGEYISFLDSDDVISNNGYEKLYELAIKNNSDLVTSRFTKFGRYNSWIDVLSKKAFGELNYNVEFTSLKEMPQLLWDTISCNKLYKKEFLDKYNIRFPNKRIIYEDIPFSLRAYILADKISVLHDIFYYWRVRKSKKLSLTQQRSNIKNFDSRIEIIRSCIEILNEECVDVNLINLLYDKWLNHDLFLFFKKFYEYSEDSSKIILSKTNRLLEIIPDEIIDNLNSYKKIIYKMVENYDENSLNYFTMLYQDLMENPHIPSKLNQKYIKHINFLDDALDEELIVKKQELVENDEDNLYITFIESINYVHNNHSHETRASLMDSNFNQYSLDIENNKIIIPINLIKDKEHMKIKMEYVSNEFQKESYLQNFKRQFISYDGFDIEIGIESNRIFCIDTRKTNDNEIKIDNITFENDLLLFEGNSFENIEEVYIENVVTFDKIYYPVISENYNNKFKISFSIPHKDILSIPVDKWEIKFNQNFKFIKISKKFEFFTSFSKIHIMNARNKILIENDLYNKFQIMAEYYDEIYNLSLLEKELKSENEQLIKKNKELIKNNSNLKKKNENLIHLIEAYKSRFVVRSSDKVKNLVKK